MMKWLRQHTKQVMVVLVLVAMFSFVGGSALVNILSPKQDLDVAEVFGEKIAQSDLAPSQGDTSILERIGLPWKLAGRDTQVLHWHILVREAKNNGIAVTDAEIDEVLASLQERGLTADYLENLRQKARITLGDIRHAIGNYLTVNKNAQRVVAAAIPSDAELRHYVRDTKEKVRVRYVALDAQQFVESEAPVAQEEVRALFEANREVDPAESDTGFGYRHPDRVKMQYILASIDSIRPTVEVTPDEIKSHWKTNKSKYKTTEYVDVPDPTATAPATTQAATQPTTQATTQPTTQPEVKMKKEKREREKTFSEAKQDIEKDLRDRKATRLAEQAMQKVSSMMLKPWLDQKTDRETGFKPVPPGLDLPEYLREIRDRVSKEFGIPLEYGETPLLSKANLTGFAGLGRAQTEGKGAERMTLSDYAFRVAPLLEKTDLSENGSALQLFQPPDAPLRLASSGFEFVDGKFIQKEAGLQKLVLFRVTEARKAGPPEGLEEVRSDVERDVRLKRAFEQIKPTAEEFHVVAQHLGVEKALGFFEELKTKRGVRSAMSPPPFARRTSLSEAGDWTKYRDAIEAGQPTLIAPNVAGVGVSEEFADACFEMIREGWQPQPVQVAMTPQIQATTTQPAASPIPTVRLFATPKLKKWFIIELLGTEIVDQDKFASEHRQAAFESLLTERTMALSTDWFKTANIETRCGFKSLVSEAPADIDSGIYGEEPAAPVLPIGY